MTGSRIPGSMGQRGSCGGEEAGAAIGGHSGQEESESTSHLFQRLSVLLMKGNSTNFVNRISDDF